MDVALAPSKSSCRSNLLFSASFFPRSVRPCELLLAVKGSLQGTGQEARSKPQDMWRLCHFLSDISSESSMSLSCQRSIAMGLFFTAL